MRSGGGEISLGVGVCAASIPSTTAAGPAGAAERRGSNGVRLVSRGRHVKTHENETDEKRNKNGTKERWKLWEMGKHLEIEKYDKP